MGLTVKGPVVFDTTACIYYLERPAIDPRCAVLLPVVAAAQAGTVDLMISTVTVAELLTGPLRTGDQQAEDQRKNEDARDGDLGIDAFDEFAARGQRVGKAPASGDRRGQDHQGKAQARGKPHARGGAARS